MGKKAVFLLLAITLLLLVACRQKSEKTIETPKVDATGDAAVDTVGNSINSIDIIENDLNIDELNDLDAGLDEIQNI